MTDKLSQAPVSPRETAGRTAVGPPTAMPRSTVGLDDSDAMCVCGHRAYDHVNGPGVPGDCLFHGFVCGCETFTPEEVERG